MDYVTPILLIGFSWIILLMVLAGWGLLAARALAIPLGSPVRGEMIVQSLWLGLALVISVIQFWHIWLPLGGGSGFAAIGVVGLTGIAVHMRRLARWIAVSVKHHCVAIAILFFLGAWIAHRSAGPCTCPDSGLYHVNAVKWSAQFPIIIGIANLHERLAFNNTNLLFASTLEFGIWEHRSHNVANGLLVAMLAITATSAVTRGWRRRCRLRPDSILGAMLLTVVVLLAVHRQAFNISSHSSNLAVTVTVMAALYMALAEILRSRSTWGSPQSNFAMLSTTALLAVSVTIKLSVVTTCGLAWVILVTIWWRRTRAAGAPTTPALTTMIVTSTMLISPWIVRTVLLSGYPAFPSSAFGFDFDWTHPPDRTKYIEEQITTWAQNKANPGEIQGWSWLRPWWIKLMVQDDRYEAVVVPIWMAVGGVVVILLRIRRIWRFRTDALRTLWLLPPIIAGMIFWFLVAPDPRFALYLFYSLSAVIIAIALGTCARPRGNVGKHLSLTLCIVLALTPIGYRLDPKSHQPHSSLGQRLMNILVIQPGPDDGFYKLPPPQLERRTTDSGLEVYVIKPGGATWDGPLISTQRSRYTPRLRLRDPAAGVRGGFNIAPD